VQRIPSLAGNRKGKHLSHRRPFRVVSSTFLPQKKVRLSPVIVISAFLTGFPSSPLHRRYPILLPRFKGREKLIFSSLAICYFDYFFLNPVGPHIQSDSFSHSGLTIHTIRDSTV